MSKKLKIGNIAPNFELPSWKDDLIQLSQLRGRYVVLFFIETIDDEEDLSLVIEFNKRLQEFAELDTVVVGISTDDSSTLQEAVNEHQLELLLLSDVLTTVHQQYDALHSKRSKNSTVKQQFKHVALVIDKHGRILTLFEEKDQDKGQLSSIILNWMKASSMS